MSLVYNTCKVVDITNFLPDDGGRGNVKGTQKVLQFILRWIQMSVLNLIAIHPLVVETFQSKCQGGAREKVRAIGVVLWEL